MTDGLGQRPPIVVLDPGHGGTAKVGGSSPNNATGPNGLLEKNLALDVARRTASALAGHVQVILTRTADTNLSLADRAAVARVNHADFFVSIHFNGFHDRAVDGTEAWAARGAAHDSVDFAQAVVRRLVAVTRVADRGVRRADLGVLVPDRLAANTAACLAEIAFLTNPEQARRLEQDTYRQQLAEALAIAVLDRVAVPVGVAVPAGGGAASTHSLDVASFIAGRLVDYFRNRQGVPLDPGAGGLSIGESALQIGDIIVSTTSHATSRLIQFGTRSQISHASIYIGGGQVVEAIGEGVVLRSLSDALADDTVAVAFRYPDITNTQQLMVRDFAGRQLGRPYNYVGIVRQAAFQIESTHCDVLPGELRATCQNWVGRVVLGPGNSDTFFCSQLVLAAFADAGIPLTSTPPSWASPQDIVNIALSTHLAYVGHLKAPPAGSQSAAVISSTVESSEERNRRLAAAIGGHGSPAASALATVTLGYGVPGGKITQPFYRDPTEGRALVGHAVGGHDHRGIDVSLSNAHGGGAGDARRGLPVYAAIKRQIDIADLDAVRVDTNHVSSTGLGLEGRGSAELLHAIVDRQLWTTNDPMAYGGIAGLACRYSFTKRDGKTSTFTLYIEYLHLITPDYLPKDGDNHLISAEDWAATGKGTGFGPRIHTDARLTADDLCGGEPILIGYLGATQFPHVHIQVAFEQGEKRYMREPRVDPTVMLRETITTTQALALALPSLSLNDSTFSHHVPGVVEERAQPSPNTCWATAATMLISWRQQASYSIATVCDMAGPEYRARFDADQALAQADKQTFLQRLGLEEEPPANYTLQAYVDMMRAYGPLWVTTDVGASGNVAIHARIMTGAEGDGSPAGSFVWLIDAADGSLRQESFEHFQQTFEQLARDVGAHDPLWIQVVHNPSGARGA